MTLAIACTTANEKDSWDLPVPEPAPEPSEDTNSDTAINDTGLDTGLTDTAITDSGQDTGETQPDTGDSGGDTGTNDPDPVMVSDFNLPDINAVSTSFGQTISPRDFIEQATGWYFIKAT